MLTININYAFNGFLYAPIFLADALGFFPRNTRLVYKSGDAETIDALCAHSSTDEKNWFAICDPFSVDISQKIPEQTEDEICVVGTLIDKLPVWVYNQSSKTYPVNKEEKLADFEKEVKTLVCYKEGTTGYLLGKRLQKLFKLKDNALSPVEFGTEFSAPIADDTVVISSDALRIVQGGLNDKKIIFNYPTRSAQVLRPFLFTAILTLRKDVVEENLWCVLAVLAGIKNAIELLKQNHLSDDITRLLVNQFAQDGSIAGLDDTGKTLLVTNTAKYLSKTMAIYSEDLRPQKQAWDNAKLQWESLLGKQLPGIEERNEPIPALLIKRDWKKDAELRLYITEGIPSIGTVAATPVLRWWHKAAVPLSLLFVFVSLYQIIQTMVHTTAPFRDNVAAMIVAILAFLTLCVSAILLTRDIFKLQTTYFNIYISVAMLGALGMIFGAVSLIK